MFDWTRAWIHLRREHAAMRSGRLIDLFSDDESYVFARQLAAETIVIGFNRENKEKRVTIAVKNGAMLKQLIGGNESARVVNGEAAIMLPAQTAVAFEVVGQD
jgi:hypothetical protein